MSRPEEIKDRSEILEWFTQARKIPELIGKLPSGERIKGGPYRPIQLILGFIVLVGGHLSMRWWSGVGGTGVYGIGLRYLIVISAAVTVTVLSRQIPLTMISPILVVDGAMRQSMRGSGISWAGHPVTIERHPQQVRSPRVTVQQHTPRASTTEPETPAPTRARPQRQTQTRPEPAIASSETKLTDLLRRSNA